MKKLHYLLLIISVIIAIYELILIMLYHDISLSKLVLFLAILLGLYSYLYIIEKMPKIITILIFLVLASFIFIEGQVFYYSLDHTTTTHYDSIIILGAQVRNGKPSPALQYRIDKAKEYLNQDTIMIASGGQGYNESMSEAICIQKWLDPDGQYPIILEENSTSTIENLQFSKEYLKGNVGIISNSFHLYRVSLIAKEIGLDVELIPAGNHLITYPHFLIREYFGILEMYLSSLI